MPDHLMRIYPTYIKADGLDKNEAKEIVIKILKYMKRNEGKIV